MKNYFKYLKQKWEIESNFQFWLIFTIFGISGTSTLFVKEPIFTLFGIDELTPFWVKFLVYIITITPAYFMLLLFYGSILGQFRFFKNFTIGFFRRLFLIGRMKSKRKVPDNIRN